MTYLQSLFIKISPVFLALFLAACGGAGGDSTSSGDGSEAEQINTDLGSVIGNPVTKKGYSGFGSKRKLSISVTITPYQKGFKVLFEPVSKHSICGAEYVIQGAKQQEFDYVADDIKGFTQLPKFYKGYIVYGANTWCGDYQVTTEWAVFADKVGFNPNQPYKVQFGSRVVDEKGQEQVFEINPQ